MASKNESVSVPHAQMGESGVHKDPKEEGFTRLSLATLGVVFGDIGTSPLYAVRECFHGEYGIHVTHANILGVISLMFWALVMIVTVKYMTFILRADNQGEGGVMALTALIKGGARTRGRRWRLVAVGLFAGCLLYGDGMITPAISVLSAVEGIRIIAPTLGSHVIPLTVCILAGLFMIQRRGTGRIGSLFGPIMFIWFLVLAVLGLIQIVQSPQILVAVLPYYGIEFIAQNGLHGFAVLGAVFLVVTGAEAMYADLGHFGKRPIRVTWLSLVFPALFLNYFGQGALLLNRPEAAYHPFYALAPSWAMAPMVILATVAAVIASQAVITGAFSLTRQAIRLEYLPRLKVTHTSAFHRGQVYVAPVNWLLMICTIGLVVGFQNSSKLAAAYGAAVTSTMLVTTTLFYIIARENWGWNRLWAGSLVGLFFLVDLSFFSANASKLLHGAWFPLAIGAVFFYLMLTWKDGLDILEGQLSRFTMRYGKFVRWLGADPPQRVGGQAIFQGRSPDLVPPALIHNINHNRIIHSNTAILHYRTLDIPKVPDFKKVTVERMGTGIRQITARFGFMEQPDVATILRLARERGLDMELENVSFFLGRAQLVVLDKPKMSRWRSNLFLLLYRNSVDTPSFLGIPPNQVMEVGLQFRL